MTLSPAESWSEPEAAVAAGAVKAKWMIEWDDPVVGLTVSGPDPAIAPDVVLVVVVLVELVGVDVLDGAVVAGPEPATPVLVVSELCAHPARTAASASVAAARARRPRP
jgi:hypothetical protein